MAKYQISDIQVEKAVTKVIKRKIEFWRWPAILILVPFSVVTLGLVSVFNFDIYQATKSVDSKRKGIEKEIEGLMKYRFHVAESLEGMNSTLNTFVRLASALGAYENKLNSPESLKSFPGGKVEGELFKAYLENMYLYLVDRSIELQSKYLVEKGYELNEHQNKILAMQFLTDGIVRLSEFGRYIEKDTKILFEKSVSFDPTLAPAFTWYSHYRIMKELRNLKDRNDLGDLQKSIESYLDSGNKLYISRINHLKTQRNFYVRSNYSRSKIEKINSGIDVIKKLYAHHLGVEGQYYFYLGKYGKTQDRQKHFSLSDEKFGKAIRNDGENPRYFNLRGYVSESKGSFDFAQKYWKLANEKAEKLKISTYGQALNGLANLYLFHSSLFPGNEGIGLWYAQEAAESEDATTRTFAWDTLAEGLNSTTFGFNYKAVLTQFRAIRTINDLPEHSYSKSSKESLKAKWIGKLLKYVEDFEKAIKSNDKEEIKNNSSNLDLQFRVGTSNLLWARHCVPYFDQNESPLKDKCKKEVAIKRLVYAIFNFMKFLEYSSATEVDLKVLINLAQSLDQLHQILRTINYESEVDYWEKSKEKFLEICEKENLEQEKSSKTCEFPTKEKLTEYFKFGIRKIRDGSHILSAAGVQRASLPRGRFLNTWAWIENLQNYDSATEDLVHKAVSGAAFSKWKDPYVLHTLSDLLKKRKDSLKGWPIIKAAYCLNESDQEVKDLYENYVEILDSRNAKISETCP